MTARYELVATGTPYASAGECIGEADTLAECERIARRKLSPGQRAAAYRRNRDGVIESDAEGCPLPPSAAWERWAERGRFVRVAS